VKLLLEEDEEADILDIKVPEGVIAMV